MTGLDPEWTIDGWLTQQAEQTLALYDDLKRERLLGATKVPSRRP